MKSFKILTIAFMLFAVLSCEKEIDINVAATNPKLVVEAKMSNRIGDAVVLLSMSRNLNDSSEPQKVSSAEVSITEMESQNIFYLNETEEGIYSNQILQGEIGKTYSLKIILMNGEIYSSIQTMPRLVELTNIIYEEFDISFQDDEDNPIFELKPIFQDPADTDNFYQFVIKLNGEKKDGIDITKDLGFDGLENTQKIYLEANYGDELSIDLHNVTSSAYTYLLGVQLNLSQSTATPTNPTSNISGDALGYFKVYSAGEILNFRLEE